MYTAAVLTPLSSNLLKWIMRGTVNLEENDFVLETAQGQQLPHHMTINMGAFDDTLNSDTIRASRAILKVDKLVYSDVVGVCAANVQEALAFRLHDDDPIIEINTINEYPHITVCLKPWAKPVQSNQMLSTPAPHTMEVELDQIYPLEAMVQVVQ